MATKILGSNGLKRMRDAYFRNDGFQEHKQIDAWLEHNAVVKEGYENGTYKMKDLYPSTYKTMTSVPANFDASKLRIADGLFEGCEALTDVNGLDLSNALSADHIFDGCTALKSVTGIVAPKCESWAYAFYECKALTHVDQWDTFIVKNFSNMFAGCTSLPSTFPWTLDITNATQKSTKYTSHIFAFSSVTDVTLKQDWWLNIKASKFKYIIGKYLEWYATHNTINMSASSITIPYTIGSDTYAVTIPEPADWLNESYVDSYRKNWELFFSNHISGVSLKLYSTNTITTTGTDENGNPYTTTHEEPKSYADDPTNYVDAIDYDEKIDRTAKTIVFTKTTEHVLKPSINITWA